MTNIAPRHPRHAHAMGPAGDPFIATGSATGATTGGHASVTRGTFQGAYQSTAPYGYWFPVNHTILFPQAQTIFPTNFCITRCPQDPLDSFKPIYFHSLSGRHE